MKGVYIKWDRIVSTFEFWSYHDREIYWTQHYLLSLLCCNLIYGHWILIIFLISQSGGQVRSWALWADSYKVKFYYFEKIICWTGFSVKLIVCFMQGFSFITYDSFIGTWFCIMFIKVPLKIATFLSLSLISTAFTPDEISIHSVVVPYFSSVMWMIING